MTGQGSRTERPRVAWVGAIMALALVARLAGGVWWQSRLPPEQRLAFGDSQSYWQLAQTIYRGEPYQYGSPESRIFRTPGYPILLAGLFWLCGNDEPPVLAARALSALCGVAAVGLVIELGWRMFDARVGLTAGLVAALHPEAISLGTFVLSEAPFHPLLLLNLVCLREAWVAANATAKTDSAKTDQTKTDQTVCPSSVGSRLGGKSSGWMGASWTWALGAGVSAGLATLMRPSWLLFTPYLLILACATRSGRPVAWRIALPLVGAIVVTMLPWWWRNYEITGRFVPTSLQVGASLYDGWRPDADGGSDMRFVAEFYAEQKAADAAALAEGGPLVGTFEERLDRRHRDAAVAWGKTHPSRVAELAVIKFLRMWSPWPNAAEMGGRLLRVVTFVGYVPVMLLAIYGTWRFHGRVAGMWLLWIPALYFTNLHLIFVSSLRYRQPALLVLFVLAAGAAWAWFDSRSRHADTTTIGQSSERPSEVSP